MGNRPQCKFLPLQTAIFCVECKLISENNTLLPRACGSKALLSLLRVLGGSLRNKETAHLIQDAQLDRLARDLLHRVPESPVLGRKPPASVALLPGRHHLRTVGVENGPAIELAAPESEIHPAEFDL
jgi:hypothetical protein